MCERCRAMARALPEITRALPDEASTSGIAAVVCALFQVYGLSESERGEIIHIVNEMADGAAPARKNLH